MKKGMVKMKRKIPKEPKRRMSYEDRIRGYERDKADLLTNMAGLSGVDFQDALCALVKKWGI